MKASRRFRRRLAGMKPLVILLCCPTLIVSLCIRSNTLAQDRSAQTDVKQLSSAAEVVEFLNKSSLPHARIALNFDGGEDHRGDDNMSRMNALLSRLSEWASFSSGFTLDSFDACQLKLKNDQVKILNWWSGSADQRFMSLSKFLMEGRKGEKQLNAAVSSSVCSARPVEVQERLNTPGDEA